jgi:hypothetical protein
MNPTRILTQFQTVLTVPEIQETEELAHAFAASKSDRQLLTMMGNLNAYAWRAAINYKAIYTDGDGKTAINLENWNNLLNASSRGEIKMMVAVKFTSDYLKKYWKGAFQARGTVMEYRQHMMDLGLFWYDATDRPDHTATPPMLERVDFARMLIFYRVFDQIRRDRINRKLGNSEDITAFDCMPKHGGMTMVTMHDALFFGSHDFRGNFYQESDIEVEAVEVTPPPRVRWRYPRIKGLCRAAWKKLVIRAGEIYDGLEQQIAIALSLPPEPLGTLADVPF